MENNKVKELIAEAMSKINTMSDANAMICDPITTSGVTIIPVAKVSVGFAGGGSDLPAKVEKECFGGGTGGGITMTPVGFLVIIDKDVRFIQVNPDNSKSAGIVNMIPEVLEKVKSMVNKDNKTAEAAAESTVTAEAADKQ